MRKFRTLYVVFIFMTFLVSSFLMIIPSNIFGQNDTNNMEDNNRPNILVIMGDDFGFSDLGVFGSEISTPNLDQLGREGKILTNYYTHPVCSPARSTFLTGVDNHILALALCLKILLPIRLIKQDMKLILLIGLSLWQNYYETLVMILFFQVNGIFQEKDIMKVLDQQIEDLIRVLPYLNLELTISHMDHTILVELLLS